MFRQSSSMRKLTPTQPQGVLGTRAADVTKPGSHSHGRLATPQASLVQDLLCKHPELATLLNYVVSQVVKNALKEALAAIESQAAAAVAPLRALISDGFGECDRTQRRRDKLRSAAEAAAVASVGGAVRAAVDSRVPPALRALAPIGTAAALLTQVRPQYATSRRLPRMFCA
jgi:hypothetical protein